MQLHEAHWILLKIISELNKSISSRATKRKDRDEKDNDDAQFQILQSFARSSAPYDCQCGPMNTKDYHRKCCIFLNNFNYTMMVLNEDS